MPVGLSWSMTKTRCDQDSQPVTSRTCGVKPRGLGAALKGAEPSLAEGKGSGKTWLWCSLPSCDLTLLAGEGLLVYTGVKHYHRFLYGRIETGLAWSTGLAQQQQPMLLQPPRTCAGPPQLALAAGTGSPTSPPAFPLAARACLLTAPILPFNSITAIKVPQ